MNLFATGLLIGALSLAAVPQVVAHAEDSGATPTADQTRMVLLLDSSGSMRKPAEGGTKIAAARAALLTVIEGLPEQAAVGMRVFGSTVVSRTDRGSCDDTTLVVGVGTGNRAELSAAVTAYKPYGETPIPVALTQAAADLGPTGQRSIVLVSDGESTCGDPCPVAEKISASGVDLTITVVGLAVSGKARAQLECIADASGGTYYDAQSAAEIQSTLEHVASRAVRPFTITGTPITGGTDAEPTPITAGDFSDAFPARAKERYYRFTRSVPGSTVRVSAYTQGVKSNVATYYVELTGEPCPKVAEFAQRVLDSRSVISAQATSGGSGPGACADAEELLVKVSAATAGEESIPFGLRVVEEPPTADPGFVATASPEAQVVTSTATPRPFTAGSGFATAPEITPGVWSSTIVPGEFNLVRFRLDYGQAALVSVQALPRSEALRATMDGDAPLGRIALYSPTWADLGLGEKSDFSHRFITGRLRGTDEARPYTAATPFVSAVSPEGRRTFSGGGDATVPGDYYLGFGLARAEQLYEMGYTVTLEITGTAQPGPRYVDGQTWTLADGLRGGGTSDISSAESPPSARPQEEDGGTPTGLLVGLGLAVVAVIGGAGWGLARRRRRPRPAGPASGPPPAP